MPIVILFLDPTIASVVLLLSTAVLWLFTLYLRHLTFFDKLRPQLSLPIRCASSNLELSSRYLETSQHGAPTSAAASQNCETAKLPRWL